MRKILFILLLFCGFCNLQAIEITYSGVTFKDLNAHKEYKADLILQADTVVEITTGIVNTPVIIFKIIEKNGESLGFEMLCRANVLSWSYTEYLEKLDLYDCILISGKFYNYVIGYKVIEDIITSMLMGDEFGYYNRAAYILKLEKSGKILNSTIIDDREIYHPALPLSPLSQEIEEYPFTQNIRSTIIKYLSKIRPQTK